MAFLSQLHGLGCIFNRVCCNTGKIIDLIHVQARLFNTRSPCLQKYLKSESNIELGVVKNGKTIVCFHPVVNFPYEFTKPIPRQDSTTDPAESFDLVLKSYLKNILKNKKSSAMEELSKVFHTTKHRWYPYGQYHTRRRKKNPPKDRI